jgi:Xaa-Pro dipeptidase
MNIPRLTLLERERRWQLARDVMNDAGVDALLVYGDRESSAPAPFALDGYFTNDRLGSIVIFKGDNEPTVLASLPMMVSDHIQSRFRGDEQWIDPSQIFVGKTGRHIVVALQRLGLADAHIGVLGLEPYPPFYFDGAIPYQTWNTVTAAFPQAVFKPVYPLFLARASVHSAEEIALLRYAASIGEQMAEAMRSAAQPGATEADLVAATTEVCLRHAGFTAEILIGSGPDYVGWGPAAWTYRAQPPRVLQRGDIVLSEIFALFGMMETQHQPAIAIGEIHPDIERAAEVARKSYEAGLLALKSGNYFGNVVDAMSAPLLDAGGWHVHPLVHSINPYGPIGFGPAPGLETLPEAAAYGEVARLPTVGREMILKKGMSFAFEPNCAFGRHLANLGGTVLVGDNGGIELSSNTTNLMRSG